LNSIEPNSTDNAPYDTAAAFVTPSQSSSVDMPSSACGPLSTAIEKEKGVFLSGHATRCSERPPW